MQVRLRAAPFEPNSPVAQELCGLSSRVPFSTTQEQLGLQQQQQAGGGCRSPGSPCAPAAVANAFLRQHGGSSSGGGGGSGLGSPSHGSRPASAGGGPYGTVGSPLSSRNMTADILNFEHRKVCACGFKESSK